MLASKLKPAVSAKRALPSYHFEIGDYRIRLQLCVIFWE